MIYFVGLAAIILVLAAFLTAMLTALMTDERRSRRQVEQLKYEIDQLVEANMSPAERAQALARKKKIEADNLRAHSLYS